MRVLFSVVWSRTFTPPEGLQGNDQIDIHVQRSDWKLRRFRKLWYHFSEAVRMLRAARGYDVLVICTASVESILAGALRPLICPRTRIVCFDFLMPRRDWPAHWFLRKIDGFACIRSGDIDTLVNRFGVSREKCSFVPFHTPVLGGGMANGDGGYVYSAGYSYRDWPTLIEAVTQVGCRAIFSTTADLQIPASVRDRFTVLPQQSPEDGRKLMAAATVVVVPMLDTHLSNGPLILLDAMAMGKAIVVTLVNGTRDYVTPQTAMIVKPADSKAMAAAISQLMQDENLRHSIGEAAQKYVREKFTFNRTVNGIMSLCRTISGPGN